MICRTCKTDKEAILFNFNNYHKIYSKDCKDCANSKRRGRHKEKRGDKFDYTHSLSRQKICSKCGVLKNLDRGNFSMSGGFHKICRECSGIKIRKPKKVIKKKERIIRIGEIKRKRYPSGIVSFTKSEDFRKGLENNINLEFMLKILQTPCIYCGYPSTGIDRINNDLGHLIENSVPCCKECNIARNNNFSHEEMFELGKTIKLIKRQ